MRVELLALSDETPTALNLSPGTGVLSGERTARRRTGGEPVNRGAATLERRVLTAGYGSNKDAVTAPTENVTRPVRRSVRVGLDVDSGRGRAEGQNRTVDTRFFRPVLYQLSYLGS